MCPFLVKKSCSFSICFYEDLGFLKAGRTSLSSFAVYKALLLQSFPGNSTPVLVCGAVDTVLFLKLPGSPKELSIPQNTIFFFPPFLPSRVAQHYKGSYKSPQYCRAAVSGDWEKMQHASLLLRLCKSC